MTEPTKMTDEQLKAAEKIKKLLDLAANNPNANEAASAAAKAQTLLLQHNLDQAAVEGAAGAEGKREQALVDGGFYKFKRELWAAVAELNFCLYWSQKYLTKDLVSQTHKVCGVYLGMKKVRVKRRRHALIGRVVNTQATKEMAVYLEGAIERVLRDRLAGDRAAYNDNAASNWAHSFRQGAARAVIEKLREAREERLGQEAEAARKAERAASGASASTALTVAGYTQSEAEANYDFMNGPGAWARREARRAEYAAERERELAEWVKWCEENPEEARKMAEEQRRREERNAKRRRGRSSFRSSRGDNVDPSAYWAGADAGQGISIHRQASQGEKVAGKLAGPKAMHL